MQSLTAEEAHQCVQEAREAYERRDFQRARDRLLIFRRQASPIATPWLLIAQTAEALGDAGEAEEALTRLLEAEPRSLPALLMMGRIKARAGDDRAATSFYQLSLNIARVAGTAFPPALLPWLREGEAFLIQSRQRFTRHLEASLVETGMATGAAGARVRHALDLLLGRSQVYLQQPSAFYFPGLPQRPFYERSDFPWLAAIEAATGAIREEVSALLRESGSFTPYVQPTSGRPLPSNPLLHDPRWSAFYLWRAGAAEPQSARCPATMAALAHAPMPKIASRSPMALFSLLKPGTHIQPHHGMLNTRLICHLPLLAPQGCALRVGPETRPWEAGKALIFDDSFEHEAWNRSQETRVILLFEIWRPEISAAEREALTRLFETIESYGGLGVDAG